jgi:hypothetical protein
MKLGLRQGSRAHEMDAAILKSLKSAKARPSSGPGVLVGFLNEEGEIYRLAALDGPAQERVLRKKLDELQAPAEGNGKPVLAVLGTFP